MLIVVRYLISFLITHYLLNYRRSAMRIRELTWRGLLIWPPQWAEEGSGIAEQGVLEGAEIIPLTDLIKIDASCAGTIISGLIFSTEEYQGSLYYKLKENIGKPLEEVGNLEVYL
jgi:hypothetical protein